MNVLCIEHVCACAGVLDRDSRIVEIDIDRYAGPYLGPALVGTLPPELGNLSSLQSLAFPNHR